MHNLINFDECIIELNSNRILNTVNDLWRMSGNCIVWMVEIIKSGECNVEKIVSKRLRVKAAGAARLSSISCQQGTFFFQPTSTSRQPSFLPFRLIFFFFF